MFRFINSVKSRFLRDSFSKGFLTLFTGSVISQLIPLLGSVILTRIYSPADFSLLALFLSVVSVISIVSTGRYEYAVVLPKRDRDGAILVLLSFCLVLFISLLTLVLLLFLREYIGVWLGDERINDVVYFIPIAVFFNGIYQIVLYWFNRKKAFDIIARSRIINNGSNTFLSIFLGSLVRAGGMIYASILSTMIVVITNSRSILVKDISAFKRFSVPRAIYLAKKYRNFPLINSVHALINTAKESYVNVFIATNYASVQLGFYYLVIRMMKLPVSLIGSSLSQVLLSQASDLYNQKKDFSKIIKKLMLNLFLVAVFPVGIIFFYGSSIFAFVFGEEWREAGELAAVISPYILFHFIASPLGSVPLILDKQGKAFFFGLMETFLFVICFLFGKSQFGSLIFSLKILSVAMPIFFIFYFRWIYLISKNI